MRRTLKGPQDECITCARHWAQVSLTLRDRSVEDISASDEIS